MNPRRTFLLRCSTVAAGALLAPSAAFAAPSLLRSSPAHIGLAEFEKNLNSQFAVTPEVGSEIMLKLVEAETARRSAIKVARRADHGGSENFSLIFRGPRNQLLPQDTYRFRHAELGELSLFIVPILSRNRRHYFYQAIFNRTRGTKMTVT